MLPFWGMKPLPKILLALTAVACTSLFSVRPAQAIPFTITMGQVGSNVVATGSGAINLTGLTFAFESLNATNGLFASEGSIAVGPSGFNDVDVYTGFTGPTSFGPGMTNFDSVPGSGDFVGISGFLGLLVVPHNYSSNTNLAGSLTFTNETFQSLGVTPGTYTWTWGSGLPNQSFTLIIGPAGVPDGGSTISLLGCALLGLAALRRKLGC
jgi:hypothetical protein